jgi:hypothetical protein
MSAKNSPETAVANNAAIRHLEPLIGEWQVSPPGMDGEDAGGHVSFAWHEDGAFVIQRWRTPAPFPSGVAVIGCDDSTGRCAAHYFDSRGVARLYEMSLIDGVWKQWREAPGFHQRFTGTFSEDGNTINASWEFSEDGVSWRHDFDLRYLRLG